MPTAMAITFLTAPADLDPHHVVVGVAAEPRAGDRLLDRDRVGSPRGWRGSRPWAFPAPLPGEGGPGQEHQPGVDRLVEQVLQDPVHGEPGLDLDALHRGDDQGSPAWKCFFGAWRQTSPGARRGWARRRITSSRSAQRLVEVRGGPDRSGAARGPQVARVAAGSRLMASATSASARPEQSRRARAHRAPRGRFRSSPLPGRRRGSTSRRSLAPAEFPSGCRSWFFLRSEGPATVRRGFPWRIGRLAGVRGDTHARRVRRRSAHARDRSRRGRRA